MWLRLASDSLVIHKDAELLILLLLPPKYWNYRFVLICMDFYFVLFGGRRVVTVAQASLVISSMVHLRTGSYSKY